MSHAAVERTARWIAATTVQPNWLPPRWRHATLGYLAAAAGQLLAVLLSNGLDALLRGPGFPSALPLLVTVLVALTFGAGPSLFAALWGAALVYYVALQPQYSLGARTPAEQAGALILLAVGVAISVLASQVARSQRGAELARADALQARAAATVRAEQLQTSFDAMDDAVLLYDADQHLVRRNLALDRMFRFDLGPESATLPNEQRYTPLAVLDANGRVVPLDRMPQMRALAGESFTGANAVDLRMSAFDGRMLDINVSAAPVRDATGRVVGAVAIYRDVTERRRLERRTQEALSALLEMAQTLVAISPGSNPNNEPETSSPLTAARAGAMPSHPIPPARHAARQLAELTQSVLGCTRVAITAVDPERESIRPLAVVGLSLEQETHMWQTWPENIQLSDVVTPQDIARLRAGAILTTDLGEEGLNAARNPYRARSVLVAPGVLRGKLVCLLSVDYASDPHIYSPQEQALASAVTQLVTLVIERERLAQERAQSQARELALRAAQDQMDRFLSLASHELRTPLTTMKVSIQISARRVNRLIAAHETPLAAMKEGFNSTIQRLGRMVAQREPREPHESPAEPWIKVPLTDAESLKRLLERADEAVSRQERLVSDLLDVSRIRTGELEQHPARMDLVALARDAIEEQKLVYPERIVTLEAPDRTVFVWADAGRIRQALANYLINALRYAPPERPVRVTIRPEAASGVARVSVRDEGPGIAPAERERIWERFYRAPGVPHTSGSGIGLGLGLYISRAIVERHSGEVGVVSESGAGAEFWFTLPLDGSARGAADAHT